MLYIAFAIHNRKKHFQRLWYRLFKFLIKMYDDISFRCRKKQNLFTVFLAISKVSLNHKYAVNTFKEIVLNNFHIPMILSFMYYSWPSCQRVRLVIERIVSMSGISSNPVVGHMLFLWARKYLHCLEMVVPRNGSKGDSITYKASVRIAVW